jgi:hypothetical protein
MFTGELLPAEDYVSRLPGKGLVVREDLSYL